MKKLFAFCGLLFALCAAGVAFANVDMAIYYDDSCPYCQHAREFIHDTLVYEYPDMIVREIDINIPGNREIFDEVIKKCEFEWGVPTTVINDTKCIKGYGPAEESNKEFRDAINSFLGDDARGAAESNRAAMAENPGVFKVMAKSQSSGQSDVGYDGDGFNILGMVWIIAGIVVLGLAAGAITLVILVKYNKRPKKKK